MSAIDGKGIDRVDLMRRSEKNYSTVLFIIKQARAIQLLTDLQ